MVRSLVAASATIDAFTRAVKTALEDSFAAGAASGFGVLVLVEVLPFGTSSFPLSL